MNTEVKTFNCDQCGAETTRSMKYWRRRKFGFMPLPALCEECGLANSKGKYR